MIKLIFILTTMSGGISQQEYGPFLNVPACQAALMQAYANIAPITVEQSKEKWPGDIYRRVVFCVRLGDASNS